MYTHTHMHYVFQHSIAIHFPTPIPSVTHKFPRVRAAQPQQHTSCRGDCTSQLYAGTAPENPRSPYLFTEGFPFPVVVFSPRPWYHKPGSQAERPILPTFVKSAVTSAFLFSTQLWPFCEHSLCYKRKTLLGFPWVQTLPGAG